MSDVMDLPVGTVQPPTWDTIGQYAYDHDRSLRTSYNDYDEFLAGLDATELRSHMAFLLHMAPDELPARLATVDVCRALWRWMRVVRDVRHVTVTPMSVDVFETLRENNIEMVTELAEVIDPVEVLKIAGRERVVSLRPIIRRNREERTRRGGQ